MTAHHRPMLRQPNHNLVGEHYRPLRSYDILARFGLPPSSPIPPSLCAQTRIGDTVVTIYPAGYAKQHFGKKRRVLATCNHCGQQVCAGHLHQHLQACKGKGKAKP